AHGIARAGADAGSAGSGGGGDGPERLFVTTSAGEEAAQAVPGARQGRVPRRLPQPRAELRLSRARLAQVGGLRRDAGRPLLRNGWNLGDEKRILQRKSESRGGSRAESRSRRARHRLQRLPAGGTAI